MTDRKPRIHWTIGFKLIVLMAALFSLSLGLMAWLSARVFVEDNTALIQEYAANTASSLASQAQLLFRTIALEANAAAESRRALPDRFLAVLTYSGAAPSGSAGSGDGNLTLRSQALAAPIEAADPGAQRLLAALEAASGHGRIAKSVAGAPQAWLVNPGTGAHGGAGSALAIALPLAAPAGEAPRALVAVLQPRRITELFARVGGMTAYVTDARGELLAHSDLPAAGSVQELPIVREFVASKIENQQLRYVDPRSGEARLAAYRRVGFAELGLFIELPEEAALEASTRVIRLSALFAVFMACAATGIGALFSGTLVAPINRLIEGTQRIASGGFGFRLPVRGADEIARLSHSFNEMAKGLEERERMRQVFGRFHDREVVERLLKGEAKLGGDRCRAIILFADLRGYTAISEALEPERAVEMLNEYLARMVPVIRRRGGVIDKYVGDMIMATWGVPFAKPGDADRALEACLEMRAELARLNELRAARGQPPLAMGMGLHTGPVTAGNIGCEERMEYTVIGDTVNVAARIESATKEVGTDLLVSRAVASRLETGFDLRPVPPIRVKGKSEPLELFQVPGQASGQAPGSVPDPGASRPAA